MTDNSVSGAARGACLCRSVQFKAGFPTLFCCHCHCTMCRRAHGAAYVTWVGVPVEQWRVTAGAELLRSYESSDHGRRMFCGNCGSTLCYESSHHPERIDVALANFYEPIDRAPEFHVFFSDRTPWTSIGDELMKLGGESGFEPV